MGRVEVIALEETDRVGFGELVEERDEPALIVNLKYGQEKNYQQERVSVPLALVAIPSYFLLCWWWLEGIKWLNWKADCLGLDCWCILLGTRERVELTTGTCTSRAKSISFTPKLF